MRWPFRKQRLSNKEAARQYYNKKEYEQAEPHLLSMLKENPEDAWCLDVLSRLYMNTKRPRESLTVLHKIVAINPSSEADERIIHVACWLGDFDAVVESSSRIQWNEANESLFGKIWETFQDHPGMKEFLANTQWRNQLVLPKLMQIKYRFEEGKSEKALRDLEKIVEDRAYSQQTHLSVVDLCLRMEQFGLLEKVALDWKRHISFGSEFHQLAKKIVNAKLFDLASRLIDDCGKQGYNDLHILNFNTKIGLELDQPQRTVDAYDQLEHLDSVKPYHVRRFATAAVKMESSEQMLRASRLLLELEKNVHSNIGSIYMKLLEMNRFDEAEQILQLTEGRPVAIDLRSTAAFERGDENRALALIDEGLTSNPQYSPFLLRKGIILNSMGRLKEAIEVFENLLALKPNHQSAQTHRLNNGIKIWEDEVYYNEIIKVTDANPKALQHQFALLNYVLSVRKEYNEALSIVQTCLLHEPVNQRANLLYALILSWLNRHEEARNSIEKSLHRWPESNDAFITASQIEKNAGNSKGQLAHLNSMLAIHNLAPVSTSSPSGAITPEFLSTEIQANMVEGPLVSIVMTTYKRDPLLDAAIHSILNQTYQNIELLIVDDCSPDDNFSYLEELSAGDERVRVFQMKENGGTYLAKNFGMTQANGDFVGFMDSDDYCHAQRIEKQVSLLQSNPDVMGVTHDYFRIDESSNIEFRGIGAIRMACISLLIRRKVIDDIGFFDSLRVGADSEYLQRIEAYYGNGSKVRMNTPSFFVMLHNSSLSGGGRFHISWRSVTGSRFQHHRAFSSWHKKIRAGLEPGYLPRELHWRPFEVSEEMKSHHFVWREGMPVFSEMIQTRNHNWWKKNKPMWQKHLSAKLAGRDFVEQLGVKVPKLYWKGDNLADLTSEERLPPSYVLKPEKGWSSNNVYCIADGHDLLNHRDITLMEIVEELSENEFFKRVKPTVMIEELLVPESKQNSDFVPRDFKFYCFGSKIAMVHVALRKSVVKTNMNVHHYFDANFKKIPHRIMESRTVLDEPLERPDCWDEMVASVQKIGEALNIYMRIDMFATNRGAVFGELTPTPHGGKGYSEFGDRFLGSYWEGEEGVE